LSFLSSGFGLGLAGAGLAGAGDEFGLGLAGAGLAGAGDEFGLGLAVLESVRFSCEDTWLARDDLGSDQLILYSCKNI
jgi:hypothetical protein